MVYLRKQKLENYAITAQKAWHLSKEWKNIAIIWQTLDHLFAIGSFTASVGTIYIVSEANGSAFLIILLSSLSAILTMMSFACDPSKYKTSYRTAFQTLNEALIAHTGQNGEFLEGPEHRIAVINAIKQGERYIGNTYSGNALEFTDNSATTNENGGKK